MSRLFLVEGNIGAGKSTCLAAFAHAAPHVVATFPEPVDVWRDYHGHNLLQQMYAGGQGSAFLFQSCVFVTCLDVNQTPAVGRLRLHERSIFSAYHCFATVMAATGLLTSAEYAVLSGQFVHVERAHPPVDGIVYLQTTPAVALERVRQRGRREEALIDEAYLRSLHAAHEDWLLGPVRKPGPVTVVDATVGREELERACVALLPQLLEHC